MFYTLSKMAWAFLSPLNLIYLLVTFGLLIRFLGGRIGGKMLGTGLILFILCGFFPVGHNLVVYLETRYDLAPALPDRVDGIIVLGGVFDTYIAKETQQSAATDNIDRMIGFLDLVRKHPRARLVFSGGAGNPLSPLHKEAENVQAFFKTIGLNPERVLYEDNSRNTYENIAFSKEMLNPDQGEKWVLVTSAYHMPRAGASFLAQGWHIIPYAVDPRTDRQYRLFAPRFDVSRNFELLELGMKEVLGTLVYYLSDKSVLPFPKRHDMLFGLQDLSKTRIDYEP